MSMAQKKVILLVPLAFDHHPLAPQLVHQPMSLAQKKVILLVPLAKFQAMSLVLHLEQPLVEILALKMVQWSMPIPLA